MKNILKSALMLLVFMLFVSVRVHALVAAVPEVDPGLAVTGFTFLVGTLAVLRSRLRK
jgi:hypothetical protein